MSMLEDALENDIDIEGNTWACYSMFCTSPKSIWPPLDIDIPLNLSK